MLDTPRLLIRQLRLDDFADLHAMQSDPETTHFIGGVWTEDKTRETLERIVQGYAASALDWHAVENKQTGRVMGVCWLGTLREHWRTPLGWGEDVIQLGYRYARAYWGNGFATEAGHAMLQWGFDELKLESIVAIVDVRNTPSEHVLQKLGMKQVAAGDAQGITIRGYRIERGKR